MRWFTCTPLPFGGGADFFARDSGLLSRGFRAIGVESMAVMPNPGTPDDLEDLIRTDFHNLESAEWWKGHRLDGVVLYAWGSPRFRNVAKAIRQSGARLVLNQDSSGAISPLAGTRAWMNERWVISGGGKSPRSTAMGALRIARGLTAGLLATDPLRAVHLRQGHLISCVHPGAVERYRALCRKYGGEDLARRVVLAPHPVSGGMHIHADSPAKRKQVVAVGRWDDEIQKRPALLMETLERLLSNDHDVHVEIIGKSTERLKAWHAALPPRIAGRIHNRGKLPHDELREILAESQVNYCPSAYESFNIAAAEALCCGCSVVAPGIPTMESFQWFVSKNSGTLAERDDADGHADALARELNLWKDGGRNPTDISRDWSAVLHADRVAAEILRLSSLQMK